LWRLKILVSLFFSFIGGGCLGTVAFLKYNTNSLFIPAACTMVVGILFFSWGVAYGANGWMLEVHTAVATAIEASTNVVLTATGMRKEIESDAAVASQNLNAVASTAANITASADGAGPTVSIPSIVINVDAPQPSATK
jgi:hypothetical protein